MNNASIILTIANLLNFIGSIPLILALFKNRDSLKGYSLFGCSITATSMYLIFIYLMLVWEPLSLILMIPVLGYWTVATIFLVRMK